MKYIICYKSHRKNGARKEFSRFDCENDMEAISYFQDVMFVILGELRYKNFELLTGDWKHIAFFTRDGLDTKPDLKPIDEVLKESKKDEIYTLYKGMTKKMQKAVKNVMLVANGKDIEE